MITVAIDIGFGNTKGVTDGQTVVFPSIVAVPSGDIGLAGIGMRTVRKATHVAFDQGSFYVGQMASSWGRVVENLDYSRLISPEAEALLYAAIHDLLPASQDVPQIQLVLGLPVPLLQNEGLARTTLDALRSRLIRTHEIKVNGMPFSFAINSVRVVAQPVGAWANWALTDDARWTSEIALSALVGIVDIGFNTLDLYGIRGGRVEPRMVGGEKLGVRRLLELISPNKPYHSMERTLQEGNIDSRKIATWISEISGFVERTWNGVNPDFVLVVGGGARLIKPADALRRSLGEIIIPDDPVMANAKGLWKWAKATKSSSRK